MNILKYSKDFRTFEIPMPEYIEMYEQDLSLSALCNRFQKDGYVQVRGCFNFSGNGDVEKAIKEALNYLLECEKMGYFMPDTDEDGSYNVL